MFTFNKPLINQPWCLSKGDNHVSISKDVTGSLLPQDIIAINFLFENFKHEFKGCILNEEDGFNVQVQVSTFLQIVFSTWSKSNENFLVLVITPEYLIQNWQEKLTTFGGLKAQIVGPKTCPKDFDHEQKLALLLSFEHIKLAETLSEYNFASVIIDHFDTVASKLVIKKVVGDFNIGVTRRNFYLNPDQKLQWTMLNWAHPGSVGRHVDFYDVDNDNFANLRDNYYHWWLTLSWSYCETFKRSIQDQEDESNSIKYIKPKRRYTRRKKTENKLETENTSTDDDNEELANQINTKIKSKQYKKFRVCDDNEHIKYANKESELTEKDTIEEGIVNSLDKPEEKNENSSEHSDDTVEYNFDLDSFNKLEKNVNDNDDNVLLNIIQGVSKRSLDHQSQLDLKKEQLYSQIFEDVSDFHSQTSDSEDCLRSLFNR